uniref:GH10808p1 n=1 Tax=Drosophila melanogaster TaxID=7227 RepID=R9TDS6_DROME|nr:GH10808p1 [Drosophila melanogaster]
MGGPGSGDSIWTCAYWLHTMTPIRLLPSRLLRRNHGHSEKNILCVLLYNVHGASSCWRSSQHRHSHSCSSAGQSINSWSGYSRGSSPPLRKNPRNGCIRS